MKQLRKNDKVIPVPEEHKVCVPQRHESKNSVEDGRNMKSFISYEVLKLGSQTLNYLPCGFG